MYFDQGMRRRLISPYLVNGWEPNGASENTDPEYARPPKPSSADH